jgi:phosphoribosylamine--glycine ligase
LEFNCRFGDPETQPIMMRLQSNLADLCLAALEQKLDNVKVEWDSRPALGVVIAAGGYPDQYASGHVISGLEAAAQHPDAKVFHAGTQLNANNEVTTSGGRVLCATSLGNNVADAQANAYAVAEKISWQDHFYRTDIGYRAVAREQQTD